MQHCTRQHHRRCFNASLCEKLSFPTHGYRMLRGRSRYQMAQLSESPNHPMRCVRDLTVHGSLQNVRPLLMAPKPKVYFQREQSEPEVFCGNRPRGVTVSTLDSESSDRGSNPREVSRQILKNELKRECNIVLDSTIAFASMRPYAKSYPSQPMGTVCGEEALGTNDTPLRRPVSLKTPREIST